MKLALTNAVVVNGSDAAPRRGLTVAIEGNSISSVAERLDPDPETHVVDLDGLTVMPGLIDCHIHFALWAFELLGHQEEPISYLCAKTQRAMADALHEGCTSARDLGGLDAGFRDAVADGICPGPRLQTSITIVSPTNGIADNTNAQGIRVPYPPGMPSPECNGAAEVRPKVRELVRAGADVIKIAVSGGVNGRRRTPRHRLFTDDEIAAAVDEAHAWGLRVACHALGGPGPLAAIRAGVDSIEHGAWLDDTCLREMAERGTWLVPTFAGYAWHETLGGDAQRRYAREMKESHRASFQRALDAGVRVACGSDAGVYGYDFKHELELLVDAGMSAGEAIGAATSRAADCLGIADEVGTLAPGKRADLLVVDGNPCHDIGILRRAGGIRCVFKDGELVRDELGLAVPSAAEMRTSRVVSAAV